MAQKLKSRPTKKTAEAPGPAKNGSEMPAITIDHPKESEKLIVGHYAVRIAAPSGAQVELIINNGEERPCRESVGYYWYDWYSTKPGTVTLAARYRVGKGRWKKTDPRSCTIVGPGSN